MFKKEKGKDTLQFGTDGLVLMQAYALKIIRVEREENVRRQILTEMAILRKNNCDQVTSSTPCVDHIYVDPMLTSSAAYSV